MDEDFFSLLFKMESIEIEIGNAIIWRRKNIQNGWGKLFGRKLDNMKSPLLINVENSVQCSLFSGKGPLTRWQT